MASVLDTLFEDKKASTQSPTIQAKGSALDALLPSASPVDTLFTPTAPSEPVAAPVKKKVGAFKEDEGMLESIFNDVGSTVGLPVTAAEGIGRTGALVTDMAKKYGVKNTGRVLLASVKSIFGGEPDSREIHDLANDLKQAGGDLTTGKNLVKDYMDWQDEEMTPKAVRGAVGAASMAVGSGAGKVGAKIGERIINPFTRKLVEHQLSSIAAMSTYRLMDPDKEDKAAALAQGVGEGVVGGFLPQALEKTLGTAIPLVNKALGVGGQAAAKTAGVLGGAVKKAVVALDPNAAKRIATFETTRDTLLRNFKYAWDRGATATEELIRKVDPQLVEDLTRHRSDSTFLAARWTADAANATNHLSKQEQSLLSPLLEGLITPDNVAAIPEIEGKTIRAPEVVQAAEGLRSILQEIGTTAQDLGTLMFDPDSGDLHRFVMLNDFVPHRIVDTEQFIRPGSVRDKALRIIMDKKKLNIAQASDWLEKFHARAQGEVNAHLTGEKHIRASGGTRMLGRVLDLPGYADDVTTTFPDYFSKMAQRIDATKRFGIIPDVDPAGRGGYTTEDFLNPFAPVMRKASAADVVPLPERATYEAVYPKAFENIAKVASPEDRQLLMDAVRRQLGGSVKEGRVSKAVRQGLLDYQVITKLGLSQLGQASQYLTAIVRSGTKGAFKDFLRSFSNDPEMMDRMLRAGITLNSTIRNAERELVGAEGSLGSEFLKRTGFTYADTRARIYGALRGHAMLEHQTEELNRLMRLKMKHINNAGAQKSLNNQIGKLEQKFLELGVDPTRIMKNGGMLDEQDIARAMQKVSTDVNFWGDTLSLSDFMKSPWGKVFTQFKTFGFQQAKFMKKWVVEPALKGDAQPLIRAMLILPAGGDLINTVKRTVRRQDLEPDAKKRLLEGFAAAGGFGVLSDTINGLNHGLSGGLSLMAGPAITDLVSAGVDLTNLTQGEGEGAVRHFITGPVQYGAQAANPALGAATAMVLPGLANELTGKGSKPDTSSPEAKREARRKKMQERRSRARGE